LAGGLAYAALFAIVPAILLTAGIAGVLFHDAAARAALVNTVSEVLPPLRGLVDVVVTDAVRDSTSVSLVGLVALIWGASRFVVAFQEAIARVMGGNRRRGLLVENLGAFVAVLLLIGALLASTALPGVAAFLQAGREIGVIAVIGEALSLALGFLPPLAAIAAMALVYRFVPAEAPRWSAAGWPAITVGIALTVLARVFVFVAPRLIGSAALLGTLATAFAALAWLALSFQAVLLGAAWVRDRTDRVLPSGAAPVDTGSG
jgi:YihY family inner membrane protein